jgi:hypothetical protein
MDRKRIADYVLFEQTGSSVFGDRYRAAKVDGITVPVHVHLYLLNGLGVGAGELWSLVDDRRQLTDTVDAPHLGRCLAYGHHDNIPFLAYRYAPGRSLSRLLAELAEENLTLSVDQSLFLVGETARGLTAARRLQAHGRPLLHGFLIPDLLDISGDGQVRVFGMEVAPGLRSQLAGHPELSPYIAPEARSGEPTAETDDVYSLGALLFHLLCGHPPRAEEGSRMREVVAEARLAAEGDPLPATIATLLQRSLAPKADRIPDTAAWGRLIDRIILDGDHKSTSFSLSFLMHSVFRRTLDNEATLLAREQRQLLMPGIVPQIETPTAADAETDLSLVAETAEAESDAARHDPFVAGFLISFLSALLLIAAWLLLLRSPGDSPDERDAKIAVTFEDPRAGIPRPLLPPADTSPSDTTKSDERGREPGPSEITIRALEADATDPLAAEELVPLVPLTDRIAEAVFQT